ncbi:10 kDa heat shock protein, mitochondrial [Cotesia typhae]|uniref:10 kDa heat shock protein, mitochondrial n=1 Tax=Cotesia typhae TaxID=2053667 RepID=UPI003D68070D
MAAAIKRIIPLMDRVLVQRADAITKTKGGVLLPENQKKVLQATVIAVGPGSRNEQGQHIPMSVNVGDKVLLPEYGGTKVTLEEDKELHLFRESDIVAKIES